MPQMERKSLLKDLDVPSVRDRDPDPNSGPRLNVLKFKLEGIVEYPKLGITREDIEELIEDIRFDLMEEYKVLESGFTEKELEEVNKLLIEIEEETQDRHVTELEVQKLVWLVREQRSNRGVTLGQIETVADRITRFYRERGFILAKAYIPRQEVRDGVVTLTLLLGTLGEVEAHNAELYDSEFITSVFADDLALPVTSQVVEENLYLLNDFPGINTTGFFEPGSQVGDTRLNINVRDEQPYDANLRFDNHGSEQTGEYRLYGQFLWNNPAGNADQLNVAALYTIDPDNSDYYQLRYSSQVLNPRISVAASISENDFVLGPGNSESINNLDLHGKTRQQELSAAYKIKRSRTQSYYASVSYEDIESQLRIGAFDDDGSSGLDDIVKNLNLSFSFDVLDEISRILHQGEFKVISGEFDEGAEQGQDESYEIITAGYSLLTFWKLPFFDANTRIIYRAELQLTDSALSSINQFSLAGPTRVRSYSSNQFSADTAFYTGVDWVFNAPEFLDFTLLGVNVRQAVQPLLFIDAAWGEAITLDPRNDDITGELYGTGFGLQISYKSTFQGNLQFAFPLNEKFSSDIDIESDDYKLVFDFQYSF